MKEKKRIFVISDSNITLRLVKHSFRTFGFLTKANEKIEGMVDKIREFNPDVIIIDADLNNFDCKKMCSILRKDEVVREMPSIIAVHAGNPEIITDALANGVSDYIYKPIDANELHSRVKTLLKLKENMEDKVDEIKNMYVKATSTAINHEINQPLSVILLAAELLQSKLKGKIDEKEEKLLNRIINSVYSIKDILYRLNLITEEDYKPQVFDISKESKVLKLPVSDLRNKIMIVDDDNSLRETLVETLKNMGHDVLDAGDYKSAVKIIERENENIKAIFCDLRINDRNGVEIYHKIKEYSDKIVFVIMTGYPVKGEIKQSIKQFNIPVFQKPFTSRKFGLYISGQK